MCIGDISNRKHLWSFAVPSVKLPPSLTWFRRKPPDELRQQRAIYRNNKHLAGSATINDIEHIVVDDDCSHLFADETSEPSHPWLAVADGTLSFAFFFLNIHFHTQQNTRYN